jgi:hypothetical protein
MPPQKAYELAPTKHNWARRASEDSNADEQRLYALASRLSDTMRQYVIQAQELTQQSPATPDANLMEFVARWKERFESELRLKVSSQEVANEEAERAAESG